jgi:hypothetical protein
MRKTAINVDTEAMANINGRRRVEWGEGMASYDRRSQIKGQESVK